MNAYSLIERNDEMLQFILGASGTGKTTLVHEKIQKISEDENSKIMLIVPEQFTYETEKSLLKQLGGDQFMRVNVTSFTRFASEVFKQFGGIAGEYASDPAKAILMDMAVNELKDELNIYQKASNSKTFSSTMLDTVTELKNAGVTPDILRKAIHQLDEGYLADKTNEIALIYETYNAHLYTTYLDPLDDITRATKKLIGTNFFQGYTVFFDEFKGFTANENDLIKMIFRSADEVFVSLCLDLKRANESDIGVFASVKETYQKLMRFAKQSDVIVKPSIILEEQKRLLIPDLKHLEQNLFSPIISTYQGKGNAIDATLCTNEYDEVDYTMASISKLVQKENYRYNDIVIISRDIDTYMTKLQVAFEKYQISYYADTRVPITNKPLIRFVDNAMKCVIHSLQSEDILGLLKSGLTTFSVEEIAELENYVYIWGIKGKQWFEPFTANPRGYKESFKNEDSECLERINTIRAFVADSLHKLSQNTKDATGSELCKAILDFVLSFSIKETTEQLMKTLYAQGETALAEEYMRIWDIFMELLDIMATTIGHNKVTLKRFEQLYQLVCSCYDMGTLPQSLDCIIIGSADRIRTTSKKAVFVLGVNENIMPFTPSSGGVFTDKEREQLISLEIDIAPPVKNKILEERFIAYKTLCSPTEKLFLTARKADISGKAMSPSVLFSQLKKMFGEDMIKDTLFIDGLFYCKRKATAFSYLAKTYYDNNELTASLKKVLSEDTLYQNKIESLEKASEKKLFAIDNTHNAKSLFGNEMNISPTRVEGFYQCHFRYFCEHGLRVSPLRKAELNPMETGTLIHSVIYAITKQVDLKNDFEEAKVKQMIRYELDLYIEQVMGGVQDKTKRFLYLYHRMRESIFKIIERLHIELSQSKFEPCDYEYEISNDSDIKPLILQNEDGTKITVAGKIDRIDSYVNSKGEKFIRIVDYKSGKKQFKLNDVLYGLNLQMLIYLFCIRNNGQGKYENSLPAGILYMPAGEQPPSLPRQATDEDKSQLLAQQYRMNGLLLMDDEVLSAMEEDLQGVFVPISTKQDGSFTKQALDSLVTLKELGKINAYINRLIKNMASELHLGKIEAMPLEGSCDYCSYSSVCAKSGDENYQAYAKYDRQALMNQMNIDEE